eukprot:1785419-Amphidinium_carterae.1
MHASHFETRDNRATGVEPHCSREEAQPDRPPRLAACTSSHRRGAFPLELHEVARHSGAGKCRSNAADPPTSRCLPAPL